MSILHTLAPVRVVGRDESDDKSDDFDSFTECGRTAHAVPTARDMRYGRRLVEVVSAWMSQETVTGRFLPSCRPEAVSGGRVE
ncbi:hypothetical protein EVAR_91772_1 [Eumeta japonica]|uniref:Uncharacterized protein n=1 Tax=Eumeta variegata TaxID=151549 RepID=A0A4C1S988_EUMVA|nr:hypothetical protein EVAR_91772_1 [Eumeta japonica]